jgi:hypothetical protein
VELTIITGRAGSGKSRMLYDRLGSIARRGGAALLLVPEQVTLAAETALLSATGLPGILDVQVMSPSRLMEDVFARLGGGGVVIDGRGRAMALRRVAQERSGELKVFGAMVRRPGFAAQMTDLIGDLKRFDVTPDLLNTAASAAADLLAGKLHDIAVTNPGWRACEALESHGELMSTSGFEVRGLYGEVLLTGETVSTNRPSSHPASAGLPEGHPSLANFLGVPLTRADIPFGMIAVGNRPGGYGPDQQETLEAFAAVVESSLRA